MRTLKWVVGAAVMTTLFTAGTLAGLSGVTRGEESAATVSLKATLNAAQEVPKPRTGAGAAGGTFAAGLVRSATGGKLSWRLTFKGLSGPAVASHVHLGKRGTPGAVAVTLCGPCRSGVRGTAKLNLKTVRALLAGTAYVNVHTKRNPAGEIRGQVVKSTAAPPPPAPPPPTTTGTTTYEPPPYP
jgi:hypothetical protein